MTSDARPRTQGEDEAAPSTGDVDALTPAHDPGTEAGAGGSHDGTEPASPTPLALPVVPLLAGLLVLLCAAAGFLWFTRAEASAVTTDDYVDAMQAARSGVVDLTSFDHLTLDDDIEQVRRVATGDLLEESVAQLDDRRQQITESEAIVSTEIVGAGVTAADADSATVLMLIQATQESNASEQVQIVKYRIQVELQKVDGRWLLSGITGR